MDCHYGVSSVKYSDSDPDQLLFDIEFTTKTLKLALVSVDTLFQNQNSSLVERNSGSGKA